MVRQVTAASANPYTTKNELKKESFVAQKFSTNYIYVNAGTPTTFRGSATRAYNDNNRLTTPGTGGGYAYDGNGNPTTYNGASLAFDARDNATSIPVGAGITAGYTSEGLRAWKQTGTSRTYFLYDGAAPVVEMDGSGNVKAVNTFGAAGLIARYTVATSGSVFYTFDETGNVSQRFDGTGTLLSTHGFQAYGQYGSTSANPDPWGYKAQSGYYTDQETGLVLCTFRYYDPTNGRWINRDPIGYEGGLNLYGYVGGNPIMGLDPSGLIDIGGFTFDGETVGGGFKTGFAAVGSAFTFGAWDGGSEKCKPGFGASLVLAGIGRDALITAATLGTGSGSGMLGRMRIAKFDKTLGPGVLGDTSHLGAISIRSGLRGQVLRETLRHELVHRFFSPRAGTFMADFRGRFGEWAYNHSHFIRLTEEYIAERYATGSAARAWSHATNPAYGTSIAGAGIEFGAYLSGLYYSTKYLYNLWGYPVRVYKMKSAMDRVGVPFQVTSRL